ncbi:MAG: hypothetical protein AVDCRST_MAG77-1450, partial [uncultured Chloroflexi bacterium]
WAKCSRNHWSHDSPIWPCSSQATQPRSAARSAAATCATAAWCCWRPRPAAGASPPGAARAVRNGCMPRRAGQRVV